MTEHQDKKPRSAGPSKGRNGSSRAGQGRPGGSYKSAGQGRPGGSYKGPKPEGFHAGSRKGASPDARHAGGRKGSPRPFDKNAPRKGADASRARETSRRDGTRGEKGFAKPRVADGSAKGKPLRDSQGARPPKPRGEFNRKPEHSGAAFRKPSPHATAPHPPEQKERENSTDRPKTSGYSGKSAPVRRGRRTKATPARLAALEAVRTVRERNAYAQDIIGRTIDRSSLTPEDRAFATRLVLGVVSAVGTLDEAINRALDNPRDISPQVRDALRISAYEILYLDKLSHVAVDQGVELVKSVAPPAAGVANLVLRSIVRSRPEFPFGDPTTDVEALARLYAFPQWLALLLISDLGPDMAARFMKESNEPAPLFVAVNDAKTREELVLRVFDRLEEPVEHVEIDGQEVPGCLRVEDSRTLMLPDVKRLLAQGRILVSDAASQWVAANVLPEEKPGSVLEVGAGRATKTILLQSDAKRRWDSQIENYLTLDSHGFKTEVLLDRVAKYGVTVGEALTGDVLELDTLLPGRTFDFAFLDAPCSGLGTLRRHPEIRWRLKPEDILSMARAQLAMLKAIAPHISVGGTLAYATCTVTHMENNRVVKAFLESEEGRAFKLAPIAGKGCIATKLGPQSPDAHFAVRFVRVEADAPRSMPASDNALTANDPEVLEGQKVADDALDGEE